MNTYRNNAYHCEIKQIASMETERPSSENLQRKRITRNRISYSCRTCRTKRVRCDKLRPSCSYCCGAGAVCIYDDAEPDAVAKRRRFNAKADTPLHTAREKSSSNDIEAKETLHEPRVQRIGSCVSHHRKDVSRLEAGKAQAVVGYLSMRDGGRSRYANSTFWADVCGNEKEVSDLLHDQECYPASEGISFAGEADREQAETGAGQPQTGQGHNSSDLKRTSLPPNSQAQAISLGSAAPTGAEDGFAVGANGEGGSKFSLSTLLQKLPSRGVCDAYYQSFVDSVHSVILLVHLPSFHQEYLSFWEWRNCTRKAQLQDSIAAVYPSFLPLLLAVLYAGSVASISHTQDFAASQSMTRHTSMQLYKCIVHTQSFIEFPQKPTLYSLMAFLISENLKIREEEPLSSCSYISTAIRIAQIMGLHRDGTHFQLDPIEVETRRRVWWHILHTDAMLATIAALPPLIISDRHYDTRMISELKDDYIDHDLYESVSTQDPTTVEGNSYRLDARLVLTIGRYQATNTIRRILRRQLDIEPFLLCDCLELEKSVQDLHRDIQDRIHRLRLLQKYRNQQTTKHDPQETRSDGSIRLYLEGHEDEFIDWASELLSLMIDKAYCLLYQPFAKDRKGTAWLHVRDQSIKHAQCFIDTFISLSTSPLYAPFYWLYPGLYQPLHVTAILLVDLGSHPTAPEAPKSLALIDRLFSIMSEDGVESMDRGILNSRSLSQSGREAWRLMRNLRTKTWEALGLDPGMIWSCAQSDTGQVRKAPSGDCAGDAGSTVLMASSNNTGGTEWPYIDSVTPRRDGDTDELLAFPDWEHTQSGPFPLLDGTGFDGWAQQDPSSGMLFSHDFMYDMGWVEWQAIIEN